MTLLPTSSISRRQSTASHLYYRGSPAAKLHLWSNCRDIKQAMVCETEYAGYCLSQNSCQAVVSEVMCWVWITSYLLFPLLNFGHFSLFHLFGLLLLLLFEGVAVGEEAVEGCEGNGVALTFVILVWTQKQKTLSAYEHNVVRWTYRSVSALRPIRLVMSLNSAKRTVAGAL